MSQKIRDRIQKLRQRLSQNEVDGIFISQPENRRYLSGFDGSAGFLVVTQQDKILATDFRYIAQAKSQAPDYEVFTTTNSMGDWFPRLTAELKIKRLGFEAGHLTFAQHRQLSDILKKNKSRLKLVPITGTVESLRVIKEPEEIEFITKAAEISDAAMEHIQEKIHTGMTEAEAAWEIERFMREKGSEPVPFDAIVASGPHSALPHAKPSARAIQAGEPIVIDIGARVGGYCSDLSRTLCLGTPDDTFKKIYDTVLGAQATAIALLEEGMSGGEADQLARIVIEEAGYGEAFGHSLGHGVGLATHEPPGLGPNSSEKLTNNMMFTIEPGVYIDGWGGVRIEDLVVMEKGKVRQISKAKK
jgi:Xaa-Pro aminopeptidase